MRIKFALLVMVSAMSLYGAAWTQERGQGIAIVNFSFLDAPNSFDSARQRQPLPDQGRFRKLELNPYIEYGLASRTTLIFSTFVPWMKSSNAYGSASSAGLGDTAIGIQRRLTAESRTVVSVQLLAQFPLYSAARTPAPGNHQFDFQSGVLVGRGGTLIARHVFVSSGAAYRRRTGAPADQFRSDAAAGMDLSRRFTVLAQYFGITGLRNGTMVNTGGNPNLQSDFDLYQAQLSLVTRVHARTRFQLGWNTPFSGRNTGAGRTLMAAFWREF